MTKHRQQSSRVSAKGLDPIWGQVCSLLQSLHTIAPAIKRNKQATTQMNLKNVMLNKRHATKVHILDGSIYMNF